MRFISSGCSHTIEERLKETVVFLSSEEMKGRKAGQLSESVSAQLQKVIQKSGTIELEDGKHFSSMAIFGAGDVEGGIVYAGFGISAPDQGYDDYSGIAALLGLIDRLAKKETGKTPISKETIKSHEYVSLEEPNEREFASVNPKGFLRRFKGGVILDEVQRVPTLFSYFSGLEYYISISKRAAASGILIHGGQAMFKRKELFVRQWFVCS